MKIAVVGATGLVGSVMMKVLSESDLLCEAEVLVVASEKSVGKELIYNRKVLKVIGMESAIALRPDIALFSAGGSTSAVWAPKFAEVGCKVIDNSSQWRMFPDIPLVVPEINGDVLSKENMIIANPNCSTMQMVMALAPLQKQYGIRRLVISTYQSVTGTGVKAVKQLENERAGIDGEMAYPWPIDLNLFPHGGNFQEDGYTTEESKLVNETRKILRDMTIQVTATVVRVPVKGGHSEAVNVELRKEFQLADVRKLLEEMPGVTVIDDPAKNLYPMPLTSQGKDDVFVGRLRRDDSQPMTLNMWIVSDNLRKGAATNAVQIAEYLIKNNLI
ncbi:MAG: aspartate-semialdehyde dehydrogenase [Sphingobacteriia bacterium]|nr:aspartate-semialdehyde dehydrogenase [Sphingobacteriia bacterium]